MLTVAAFFVVAGSVVWLTGCESATPVEQVADEDDAAVSKRGLLATPGTPEVTLDDPTTTTVESGQTYTLDASFTDSDADGPWTYRISWGDGTNFSGNAAAPGPISESYKYCIPSNNYTLKLKVTDAVDNGGGAGPEFNSASKRVKVLASLQAIDVVPGAGNTVTQSGGGNAEVALLSTAGYAFDARNAVVGQTSISRDGVTKTFAVNSVQTDVNGDGFTDQVFRFSKAQLAANGHLDLGSYKWTLYTTLADNCVRAKGSGQVNVVP
jgi:hypothetical protein